MNTMLTALATHRGFVSYRLAKLPTGKADKIPFNGITGYNSDAQDPATWTTPDMAEAFAREWAPVYKDGTGVGIVIYGGSQLFCIDIDGCIDEQGNLSEIAQAIVARFPGAVVEVSVSGKGLHIFGMYQGVMPPHAKKNTAWKIELYTEKRFIALTGKWLPGYENGHVGTDCTDALTKFAAEYFPAKGGSFTGEWTDGPAEGWDFITDDDELLAWAATYRDSKTTFGGKAPIQQLMAADESLGQWFPPNEIGQHYDASSADQSLANFFAWATGNNCERTERLMRRTQLARPKWDNRDDYLRGTIAKACAEPKPWPSKRNVPVPAVPVGTQAPHDAYKSLADRTDKGNANLLIRLAGGNLRYVAETKQWLRWDGRRWQVDTHEVFVTTQAVEVARHYMHEAKRLKETGGTGQDFVDSEDYSKWASKCRNKQSIDNMIALARKSDGVPVSITELDRNAWLLGVDNGVVDLRTGALHESEAREEFVTKRCPIKYNPEAAAPRWESIIAQITGLPIPAERDANGNVIPGSVGRFTPRPALARYLQKALGYSITGSTEEHKFFLAIGEGSNGKGVIFDTVKAMLGPYAVVLPAEALMASKHDTDAERPTALAATLAGARLVVASESKEGQKLNMAMIKAHTGDKEMQARRMRENPFTFTITHKLWLLTNVRPTLDHLDAATKGRLHFTPFDRRWNRPGEVDSNPALPDGDKTLMAHLLKAEAEGVLAWLIRGAVMYSAEGLTPPDEVTALTREYVMEQDHLGRWLATLQRCAPKHGTMAAELFRQFGAWCGTEGATMDPSTATGFGRALRSRGVEWVDMSQGRKWGLCVPVPPPPTA